MTETEFVNKLNNSAKQFIRLNSKVRCQAVFAEARQLSICFLFFNYFLRKGCDLS